MQSQKVLLMLGAALTLTGCGGDPLDMEPDTGSKTTTVEAEKGRGTTQPEAETGGDSAARTPAAEAKAAKRRLIYLDARTLCAEFGVRQIVRRFGLRAGGAADVARAYSERNYSGPFREAGYRGCLVGFRK